MLDIAFHGTNISSAGQSAMGLLQKGMTWQSELQPSPPWRCPSSHCSAPSTTPLPHTAKGVSTGTHCGGACTWALQTCHPTVYVSSYMAMS